MFILLILVIVFIFSGLIHYIYCRTLISTIILWNLIILLFTLIAIIILLLLLLLLPLPLPFYFIYLFHLKFINLFIYLLIRGPIRPEGSPFGRFFNLGMLRVEEVS